MLAGESQLGPHAPSVPKPPAGKLPKWLRRLSTESWQVELLISGFAVAGSTQLIGLVEPMAKWILLHVRLEYLTYLRYVLYYLALGFVILPATFIVHFAFRTYWVGLVGLSSVYPHGFGGNYGTIPEWLAHDTEARHPSLPQQIDKVERRSSIMFAVAALSAMIFASIAISLAITFALGFAVNTLSEGAVGLKQVFIALLGLSAVVYTGIPAMPMLKRYHGRPGFRHAYLALNSVYSKSVYTIFEQPITYLITILSTNISTWKAAIGPAILGYFVLLAMVGFLFSKPATGYLVNPERITSIPLRTDLRDPSRYRSEWVREQLNIHPSIETEFVTNTAEPLLLSLPMLGEDEHQRDMLFPQPDSLDELSDPDRKQVERAASIEAGRRYWRLHVDDTLTLLDDFIGGNPAGQSAYGYMAYIDVEELAKGPHMLRLDVARDTGWKERAAVPFRIIASTPSK